MKHNGNAQLVRLAIEQLRQNSEPDPTPETVAEVICRCGEEITGVATNATHIEQFTALARDYMRQHPTSRAN